MLYRQIVNEKVMVFLLLSGSEEDDPGIFLGPRDQLNNGICLCCLGAMCWSFWLKTLNLWHSWSWHTDALEKVKRGDEYTSDQVAGTFLAGPYYPHSSEIIPSWQIMQLKNWLRCPIVADSSPSLRILLWGLSWTSVRYSAFCIVESLSPIGKHSKVGFMCTAQVKGLVGVQAEHSPPHSVLPT